MRPTHLVAVTLLGVFSLSGCILTRSPQVPPAQLPTTSSPLPPPMPSESPVNLRSELERIYTAARTSIDEATPETYFTYVEEATKDPQKVAQFEEQWPEAQTKNMMKNFLFTDLSKTEFITAKQEGDWAGYYYLSSLEETDRLTINLFRFHRVGDKWMAYPKTSISSIPYEGKTAAERAAAIETEIGESDSLKAIAVEGKR